MTLNSFFLTIILFTIAASLWALVWLVNEIDKMGRQKVIATGVALNRNLIRINGQKWDVPRPLNQGIKRGHMIFVVARV